MLGQEKETRSDTSPQDSAFLEEKAFRARTVLVFGTITDKLASETVRKLLALDAESTAPITMIVSSPGGHLESGDAIHDVVRFISSPVTMVGTGWVGSAATHLFLGAARERLMIKAAGGANMLGEDPYNIGARNSAVLEDCSSKDGGLR